MRIQIRPEEQDRITLDRSQGRPAAERTGFVGLVSFHDGPRGGRYRSLRTEVFTDFERALEAGEALAERPWKQSVRGTDVIEVTAMGEEV